ncbi:hypothetical protein [Comamonas aquatica]|uniref:hypothetical protein n=1 Tax=Comamonas aquatica TaxID=225991 RepID=UPI003CFFAC86
MSMTRELRLHATAAAAVTALALLAGCDQSGPQMRADTFPMGQAAQFDQPPPDKPLFGSSDYLRAHDVLPHAKADIREPLPPAVPLPAMAAAQPVVQPQASTAEPGAQQGGVTPAAGMAAGITNAQGDGEKHKLDGGTVK